MPQQGRNRKLPVDNDQHQRMGAPSSRSLAPPGRVTPKSRPWRRFCITDGSPGNWRPVLPPAVFNLADGLLPLCGVAASRTCAGCSGKSTLQGLLLRPRAALASAVCPSDIGVKECLGKAHGMSEQSLAKIEALGQRHVQTRIEHEMSTACFPCICARHRKQSRADAITSKLLLHNKVVNKDEAPIQKIFLQPIANDPDNSVAMPRCRQTISMFTLTHHLSNERAGILQMRAQLHHDRVTCADLCELLDTSELNIPAHGISGFLGSSRGHAERN